MCSFFLFIIMPMYIDTVPNRSSPPVILLRESYWHDDKSKKRTHRHLSKLPRNSSMSSAHGPQGQHHLDKLLDNSFDFIRSVPHDHVAAVLGSIHDFGLDKTIPAHNSRLKQICIAMIAERILERGSKLAAARGFSRATGSDTLGIYKEYLTTTD